ncbi:hypothetical protein [Aureibacter tunicatorum]|uniref:Uncharacterized protein n=1 Tax=Aureibacter tunicatorum TaxID=866807 RepID=A0AAE3XN94_9BACT|nr:hypothetical protein [Aureibacter tunicatorum]MDR6241056.1 hypothetical protein [Aureibacter tunicatorum]BDD03834.1 hypothetical protein AUTU_13170 [Aureibacter tunicatorum]
MIGCLYLNKEGDDANVIRLYDTKVEIIEKGVEKVIFMDELTTVSLVAKKFLVPLVSGGIVFFFTLIYMLKAAFFPVALSFSLLIVSFLMFFYGWRGYTEVRIETIFPEHDSIFVFRRMGVKAKAFFDLMNQFIYSFGSGEYLIGAKVVDTEGSDCLCVPLYAKYMDPKIYDRNASPSERVNISLYALRDIRTKEGKCYYLLEKA